LEFWIIFKKLHHINILHADDSRLAIRTVRRAYVDVALNEVLIHETLREIGDLNTLSTMLHHHQFKAWATFSKT